MKNLLERVWTAGIDLRTNKYRRKYIRLLNEMAVIFSISDTVFMIIFGILGAPMMTFYLMLLNAVFLSIPLLNHYRLYSAARIVMITSLYGGVCFFSSVIGPDSLIDIIYVSVLTVPFAISGRDESRIIYVSLFLSVTLFWLFHHTEFFRGFIIDNPPVDIRYPITVFIFIMPFLVLHQMKKEQNKYEDILEKRAYEIHIMNEKLTASNAMLERTIANLKQSMSEREVLLREIHHRVKNNMQIINSLLNLQSRYTNEKNTKSLLKHSQHRINSMAMVHELLYRSGNFSEISCRSYMNMLVRHLVASMVKYENQVTFSLNTPDEFMSMDTAIPLGLLVNEIITNSLKHGFEGGRQGSIYLDMRKEGQDCIIEIGDNGIGYQGSPNEFQDDSLGMLLINNLIGQLNGRIIKKDIQGTHYEIHFKDQVIVIQQEQLL